MLAITHDRYGGPEVLQRSDWPSPEPGPRDLIVGVRAAGLNAADRRLVRADPFLVRLENGWWRPKTWRVLGSDYAGEVVAVGGEVTTFQVGDRVFGDATADGRGSFAERLRVRTDRAVPIPEGLSFVEAACVPLAGITALQALRDCGEVAAGDRVLVVGAGGGVGTWTVQVARALGARVTAVCGPDSAAQVGALGADEVMDRTQGPVFDGEARWDVIVAVNGRWSPWTYRAALRPGGRLVVVGGENRQIFEGLLLALWVFFGSGKRVRVLTTDEARVPDDLRWLAAGLAGGALRAVVDRTFPLAEAADAMRTMEAGHVGGKLVLVI